VGKSIISHIESGRHDLALRLRLLPLSRHLPTAPLLESDS